MEILQGFVDAVVGIFEDSGLLTLKLAELCNDWYFNRFALPCNQKAV